MDSRFRERIVGLILGLEEFFRLRKSQSQALTFLKKGFFFSFSGGVAVLLFPDLELPILSLSSPTALSPLSRSRPEKKPKYSIECKKIKAKKQRISQKCGIFLFFFYFLIHKLLLFLRINKKEPN
jgi:hypothetical protein